MVMNRTVFVLDDEAAVRESTSRLLRSAGYEAKAFSTAESFMSESLPMSPSCLILDMRLSTESGFDVLAALDVKGVRIPVIIITGYGSIPMTVRAMKAGAVEFLTKPVSSDTLLKAVDEALARAERDLHLQRSIFESKQRYENLTSRERDVFRLAIAGLRTKQIATELGIQHITARVHKQRVMEKMGTKSLTDLVRAAERLKI